MRVLEAGIESVYDKMSLMEKAARFHAKKNKKRRNTLKIMKDDQQG